MPLTFAGVLGIVTTSTAIVFWLLRARRERRILERLNSGRSQEPQEIALSPVRCALNDAARVS